MTKRLILLAGAVLIVLSAAPDAMASHCLRCKWYVVVREWACVVPAPSQGGYEFCNEGGDWCETSGAACPPHGASAASLASEYTVASVTRLDEPDLGASQTLAAQSEIAPTEIASTINR